jgi:hypothetical protein
MNWRSRLSSAGRVEADYERICSARPAARPVAEGVSELPTEWAALHGHGIRVGGCDAAALAQAAGAVDAAGRAHRGGRGPGAGCCGRYGGDGVVGGDPTRGRGVRPSSCRAVPILVEDIPGPSEPHKHIDMIYFCRSVVGAAHETRDDPTLRWVRANFERMSAGCRGVRDIGDGTGTCERWRWWRLRRGGKAHPEESRRRSKRQRRPRHRSQGSKTT